MRIHIVSLLFLVSICTESWTMEKSDQIEIFKKPSSLIFACINRIVRPHVAVLDNSDLHDREVRVEDAIVTKICSGDIPGEIGVKLIKAFSPEVVENYANKLIEVIMTGLNDEIKFAIIKKLGQCNLLTPYHDTLQKLWADPVNYEVVKNALNNYDPLFQYAKSFLTQLLINEISFSNDFEGCFLRSVAIGAWSPDGTRCAIGTRRSNIANLWNIDGTCITLSGHEGRVNSIAWSADGTYFATGSEDKTIKIWTVDGACIATLLGHESRITSIIWISEDKKIVTGSEDKTIKIWTIDGTCIETLSDNQNVVTKLAWSPNNNYLAIGLSDGTMQIWTIDDRVSRCVMKLSDCVNKKRAIIAWSPDGNYLAVGSADDTVKIWLIENESLKCMATLPDDEDNEVKSVVWSPDGKNLAADLVDGTVKIWALDDEIGTCIMKFSLENNLVIASSFEGYLTSDMSDTKAKINSIWKIKQHIFSHNEIYLIEKIADAQKSGIIYVLNEQEQAVFNTLAYTDQKFHTLLVGLIKPYISELEVSEEEKK